MNDDQITELARLELGVAAVFQNEWQEPVLCKVQAFHDRRPFTFHVSEETVDDAMECVFEHALYGNQTTREISQEAADQVKRWLSGQNPDSQTYLTMMRVIETGEALEDETAGETLYDLSKARETVWMVVSKYDTPTACAYLEQYLADSLHISRNLAVQVRIEIANHLARTINEDNAIRRSLIQCAGGDIM